MYVDQGESVMYKVRIKNTMFGYERDQIVEIAADSEAAALKKARDIDCFAEVSIVE
jgi:hypothetical protein